MRHDCQLGVKEVWRKGMLIDFSEWAKEKKNEETHVPYECLSKGNSRRRRY